LQRALLRPPLPPREKPLVKGKSMLRERHMLREKINNPEFISIIRHNEISDSWPGEYW